MWTVFFVFLITVIVFFLLWMILYRKKDPETNSVTFVCGECGERDCICQEQEDINNHQ